MQLNTIIDFTSTKKQLIFIGGEAGVGKSLMAKHLADKFKENNKDCFVIDKDDFTSVLTEEILKLNNCSVSDRESETYLNKVRHLEYKQIDNMLWNKNPM